MVAFQPQGLPEDVQLWLCRIKLKLHDLRIHGGGKTSQGIKAPPCSFLGCTANQRSVHWPGLDAISVQDDKAVIIRVQ